MYIGRNEIFDMSLYTEVHDVSYVPSIQSTLSTSSAPVHYAGKS